jgi:hypothetical protein
MVILIHKKRHVFCPGKLLRSKVTALELFQRVQVGVGKVKRKLNTRIPQMLKASAGAGRTTNMQ